MTTTEATTWLTYEQAAEQLRCSTKTIQRRVREGTLKPHRIPGRPQRLLRAADIAALAEPQPIGADQ